MHKKIPGLHAPALFSLKNNLLSNVPKSQRLQQHVFDAHTPKLSFQTLSPGRPIIHLRCTIPWSSVCHESHKPMRCCSCYSITTNPKPLTSINSNTTENLVQIASMRWELHTRGASTYGTAYEQCLSDRQYVLWLFLSRNKSPTCTCIRLKILHQLVSWQFIS